jgi:hypothetical protein
MFGYLRQWVRATMRGIGRCLVPVVVALGRRPPGPEIPVSVHLLVSSKTWRMGLLAAMSLEFFSGKRWTLYFHDDGSVDEGAHKDICARLPGVRFVPRKEADEAAGRLLENFPACARNRGRHNLFLKFFDPIAFAPGDKYLILDADLFFYRSPEMLLKWALGSERACYYNEDTKEVYCLPREQIEEELGVSLWAKFNSGLVCICREAINLSLSERLLAAFDETAWHPQFFEQTLYAVSASAFGSGGPLPPQYEITWNIFRRPDSICRHYVGPAKWDHLYFEGPATLFARMTLPSLLFSGSSRK